MLVINPYFTNGTTHPFDTVEWERRDAVIQGDGAIVFEQKGVEFPKFWSQLATNVVAQKYFRGALGTPEREYSLRQLITRVVKTIADEGETRGYFNHDSAMVFERELAHLILHQKMAFNSPVWFNVGVEANPQCSACFINSVEDTMDSILTLAKTEGMLFKYGSGTGTNLSTLRSSREPLKGGGSASGPVSFMRGFDAFAGVIKSGGKTRRAAKMVILNCDHPDIRQFIACKAHEEKKAHALIDAGYDGSFNGEAYNSVMFQNSNNSVRVTDEFMNAVCEGAQYPLKGRDGSVIETVNAQDIWREIADAAWQCGDPGVQFDTVCNEWHTVPVSGRINASNPCAEYMHLDDSACNLASLNLRKFTLPGARGFDVRSFTEAVDLTILAQEIIVGFSSYPTPRIWDNSHRFRPLGLGYANLGAMLMSWGIPYDSHEGRSFASSITALMTGAAYRMSAEIARACGGPCVGFAENREPFLAVIQKHRQACDELDGRNDYRFEIKRAALHQWDIARTIGLAHGFRNSQATVLAPTGTIGFMMDCDTTGVEPDIALVKYKRLVGGGMLKITNQTVTEALRVLGYTYEQQKKIVEFIENNDTIEGSLVAPEHLPVFDCAFRAEKGTRSIQPIGHIRMMAAVQPFLSGAISKTVNMPSDATVEDIAGIYMLAWKLRLKAVAIYRDGCKRIQPLSTSSGGGSGGAGPVVAPVGVAVEAQLAAPARRKLPDERQSITHKFVIGNHEGYIHVGLYPDGTPGELFITMSKEGSTISGLMDSFATAVSLCLQYGAPLRSIVDKFSRTRFEPSGWSGHESIGHASSVLDYIARWLELKFLPDGGRAARPSQDVGQVQPARQPRKAQPAQAVTDHDAPLCHECGTVMVRSGACHKCSNCGATSGCS